MSSPAQSTSPLLLNGRLHRLNHQRAGRTEYPYLARLMYNEAIVPTVAQSFKVTA